MKKLLFTFAAALLLVACTGKKTPAPTAAPKMLVVYYSQNSTTRSVAEEIAERTHADLAILSVVNPFDGSFEDTVQRSLKEREEGILPELKPLGVDPSQYDIIFLGYPIWFGTYAPPIASFVEKYKLEGRKVVPFCSFGSGGLSTSVKDLRKALPDAEILPGYGVRASRLEAMPKEVDYFLKAGGYIEGEVEALPEFSSQQAVTPELTDIFNKAVEGYTMLSAVAKTAASRRINGGTEYLFTAESADRDGGTSTCKVYVVDPDEGAPEFTQVER